MEQVLANLLPMLLACWWPFVRCMAMLSMAPVLGEMMVPVTVRILVSLVLAIVLLPLAQGQGAPTVDPFSLHGVAVTVEQAVIGAALGLALHFSMAVVGVLGFLVSSQLGFSLAVMNDPMNGTSSDVVSALLAMLAIVIFVAIDGHLVLVGVTGASFKAWPPGGGYHPLLLQTVAWNVAWIFSAALLLAIPVVLSTLVVQLGLGLLNRVAPTLNLFALGYSLITLFGLLMLGQVVRFIPQHYLRMSARVLDMIQQQMVPHG